MRGVLRVEVDAVKFLKEEPHKLDCMLKRVKTLTEILTELRRYSTENLLKGSEPTQVLTTTSTTTTILAESFVNVPDSDPAGSKYLQVQEQVAFIQPQSSSSTITPEPQTSSVKTEVMPSSPVVIHHVQSSPVFVHQSQHSEALVLPSPSPPAAPAQCPDFSALLQSQQYVEANTVMQQKHQQNSDPASLTPQGTNTNGSAMQSLFIEEIHTSRSKSRNRVMSIEAAEKEWEEKRQNMGQYDGKEFEKLLQEAQANMMKGIPSLEVMAEATVQPPPQMPASNNGDVTDRKEEFPASEDVPLASPVEEKAVKCPPPPPPRRSYPPGSGLTTGRSGEVIFTAKKESVTIQKETQEEVANVQSSQTSCETKATQHVAPRVVASAVQEEEDDDGDKIMAELQVFQKCTFMDVGTKSIVEHPRVETQVKEIRPSALMSPKEKKATSVISPSSRMPVPVSSKSRSQQGVSDKSGKQQKLQDPQRQFRQANGSAKKAGGDSKSASPALPASKIPAFSPSSGKNSSVPASSSEGTNPTNSSPRSSIPSPNLLNPQANRSASCPSAPSKHIPSLSNGSLKLQSPTLSGKGQSLSFSAQTPNGRPTPSSPSSSSSSSSSSPSPISPTSLSQGGKTIRTIHTPSFISYRAQNGNSKPLPSPAKDVV
uniref:KIAA1217 n=1 Tax=Erpetoichthys calabaricus TaxID=27687 RepID=A0A8C4S016_ERPCA